MKRLTSRFAFVLTGTPIENRIDEIYSLMDFLNPAVLGPLFRFNRDFYEIDERGRPCGYKHLERLHDRIAPYMLRRRKSEVETELPERTDKTFFVPLSAGQKQAYLHHEDQVARLAAAGEPLALALEHFTETRPFSLSLRGKRRSAHVARETVDEVLLAAVRLVRDSRQLEIRRCLGASPEAISSAIPCRAGGRGPGGSR